MSGGTTGGPRLELGLDRSDVARDDVFLTTKLWVDDHGHDSTLRAFEASLRELRTDHVDLHLHGLDWHVVV